jgi:aerotaxis receptor
MKKNLPITQVENHFGETVSLISTTDTKGRITYCNQDFVSVSGFLEEELIGASHNIVRHPDMPPAAFEDLWATIKAGDSWQGIVKNRCKDGNHYWVEAFVSPVIEKGQVTGYQSVRSKPSREQVAKAEAIYQQLNDGRLKTMPKSRSLADVSLGLRMFMAFVLLIGINIVGALGIWLWPGQALQIALAVSGLVSLAALVIWWLLNRSVITPLVALVESAKAISAGDLSQPVRVGNYDEIGQLRQAVKTIQARLRAVIGRMIENAAEVSRAVDRLSATNESVNGHMNQQRAETEHAAAAMNQMAEAVTEVSRNVVATADAAQTADAEAHRGEAMIQSTLGEINALVGRIQTSVDAVHRLEGNGQSIVTIMSVIQGIAEQTNLLALNAAIEAARAGDVGRGFAVVADEVRSLASRTKAATEEIHGLIKDLGKGIENTVDVMGEVRHSAETTQKYAVDMGVALKSITGSISHISDMANQIATASTEQSAVADDVNRNMTRIHTLSAETMEEAQGNCQASNNLAGMVGRMRALSASFRMG